MKKLKITVDGKPYEVTVEILGETGAATAAPFPTPAKSASAVVAPVSAPKPMAAAGGEGSVPCPLAGKVVAIDVKEGATVAEGDTLITLEAMKMNTFVTAPSGGVVSGILVSVGDAVEEGQALLTVS